MAFQHTDNLTVYSTVCSGEYPRQHQSSVLLAILEGIHRWPVDSPNKGRVMSIFHTLCQYVWLSWWKIFFKVFHSFCIVVEIVQNHSFISVCCFLSVLKCALVSISYTNCQLLFGIYVPCMLIFHNCIFLSQSTFCKLLRSFCTGSHCVFNKKTRLTGIGIPLF